MNKKKFELLSINKKQKLNFSYKKKIIVRDLLLNIVIGYYRSEKIKKQNVKFNIELDYTNQKNHNDNDIKSIVDYGRIVKSIKNLTAEHISFVSTLFFNGVERYCFLKCFTDCLLFFIVGPGAMPLTLIFGAKFIAEVLVSV